MFARVCSARGEGGDVVGSGVGASFRDSGVVVTLGWRKGACSLFETVAFGGWSVGVVVLTSDCISAESTASSSG